MQIISLLQYFVFIFLKPFGGTIFSDFPKRTHLPREHLNSDYKERSGISPAIGVLLLHVPKNAKYN